MRSLEYYVKRWREARAMQRYINRRAKAHEILGHNLVKASTWNLQSDRYDAKNVVSFWAALLIMGKGVIFTVIFVCIILLTLQIFSRNGLFALNNYIEPQSAILKPGN